MKAGMRRVFALLVALVMVLGFPASVFAFGGSRCRVAVMNTAAGTAGVQDVGMGETNLIVRTSWLNDDETNRPEGYTVQLRMDGYQHGDPVAVTAESGWTYEWRGLPDGHTWTVDKVGTLEGYVSRVTLEPGKTSDGEKAISCNIAHDYSKETGKVDVVVQSDWGKDDPSKRRNIYVVLWRDGEYYSTAELYSGNGARRVWTDLDSKYTWTVSLSSVHYLLSGYESDIAMRFEEGNPDDGTNARVVCVIQNEAVGIERDTDVSVVATWANDKEAYRPDEMTVQLMMDGSEYGDPVKLTAENGWKYDWTDLPAGHMWRVDKIGALDGYETRMLLDSVNPDGSNRKISCTIANDYVKDRRQYVDVVANIHWENDDVSIRTEDFCVDLWRNGENYQSVYIDSSDN